MLGVATKVLLLCLACPDAMAFLSYTDPETGHTLTVCTCAKCGSTSLGHGLYKAFTGSDFKARGPPWVQYVKGWKDQPECVRSPTCGEGIVSAEAPETPKAGDITVVVTRDPLERYVSAFGSKLACCDSPRAGISRRWCGDDGPNNFPAHLLNLAGLPPLEAGSERCLYWGEYADALTRIRRLGRQSELDMHFSPQPSGCNYSTALLVDTSEVGTLLNGLQGFGPALQRYPKGIHHHQSRHNPAVHSNATTLCEVAMPEYAAIGRDVPAECSL